MGKKLAKRLSKFFYTKTTPLGGKPFDPAQDRYIPLAFSRFGPGWGVFDRLQDRFLTDDETWALPDEALMNERITQ